MFPAIYIPHVIHIYCILYNTNAIALCRRVCPTFCITIHSSVTFSLGIKSEKLTIFNHSCGLHQTPPICGFLIGHLQHHLEVTSAWWWFHLWLKAFSKFSVFFLSRRKVIELWIVVNAMHVEVNDGLVVRAGVSVTWSVLSWSGGHEFEPQLDRTWGAWYLCPKLYLNKRYHVILYSDDFTCMDKKSFMVIALLLA